MVHEDVIQTGWNSWLNMWKAVHSSCEQADFSECDLQELTDHKMSLLIYGAALRELRSCVDQGKA